MAQPRINTMVFMAMSDPVTLVMVQLIVLGVPAGLLAWTLRRAGVPGRARGAAVASGVSIGLLLGPNILGAGWPDVHDPLFRGGAQEARAHREMRLEHARELKAISGADISQVAIDELSARQAGELAPLTDALAQARATHRHRLDLTGLALAALVMLCAGALAVRNRAFGERDAGLSSRRRWAAVPGAATIALLIGIAPPAALWRLVTGDSWLESLAFGFIVGAPAVSAALCRAHWLCAAIAGAIGLLGACALASPIGAALMVTAASAGAILGARRVHRWGRRCRRAARTALVLVALPTATALLTVRLDLRALAGDPATRWAFWWAIGIALVWSSDGRMLAWLVAFRVRAPGAMGESRWVASARMVNAGVDVLMIVLGLVIAQRGASSESVLAAAVFGGALVAITPELRLLVGRMLDGRRVHPTRTSGTIDSGR